MEHQHTQKVYFSRLLDPEDWNGTEEFATFFLIPKKWWSIEAWGFASSLRSEMLRRIMINFNATQPKEK